MKKAASTANIKEGVRTVAKNKTLIILSGLLFLSVAYNIWWVGFERDGNADTINDLNRYIELSRDAMMELNEYAELREEYSILATQALFECGEGDWSNSAQNADGLADLGAKIGVQKERVITAINDRTEFANSTGLEVTYSDRP